MTFSRSSALAALALCVGCGPSYSDDLDKTALKDAPAFKHVAEALKDGDSLTVGGLLAAQSLNWNKAPDPTALLNGFETTNNARTHTTGTLVSMLTYNLALLDVKLGGVVQYSRSPKLDVRRKSMPSIVMTEGFDIITLQELWLAEDIQRFKDAAPAHGYTFLTQDRSTYNDGLGMLIKTSLLKDGKEPETEFVPYEAQDTKEGIPTVGIKRGFMRASFEHVSLGKMHVYSTHMQAFPESWAKRLQQARQLGLHVRAAAGDQLALIGGDMNAGPYYRDDVWHAPSGDVKDWYGNTLSYDALLHYANAMDAFAMGQQAQDVPFGNRVVNNPLMSTSIPGAAEGWCGGTPNVVFTATDCNSLYFQQYAGTEYPARLDHIDLHDPGERVHVVASGLAFTNQREWPNSGTYELSDHFGVHVSMLIKQ